MATFAYIARNSSSGERVSGRMDGANQQAVMSELAAQGLAPVTITEARRRRRKVRIGSRKLAGAYQQLSDLLRAGVPLLRALRLLGRSKSDANLATIMSSVADSVAEGERLADALSRHGEIFPPVHIAMIRAGERGGFLEQVLARLGAFLTHQADLRSTVIGNLIYPVVLLVVGSGIVLAALIFFVPRFAEMYSGMALPLPTKILLGASSVLTNFWPLLLIVLGVFVAAFIWLRRKPKFRRRVATWQLRIPKLGSLNRSLATSRFTRILGTMLDNGIPMLAAMRISRDAAGHILLAEAVDNAGEAVRAGESLAEPLGASGMFEEDVIEMIAVGESANNLPEVLMTIAETIENRVDRMLNVMVRLMEPLLLLVLGGMVMFIFMALIVPMMQMSSGL